MRTIDLAKRVYESFSKLDLDGVLSCLATDVEWKLIGPKRIPYFGTYHGINGVKEFFTSLFEAEQILEFVPVEFIDGGDTVVVLGHERSCARITGIEFVVEWAHVFYAKNGKIVRWTEYIDTAPMAEAYC